MTEGSSDTREVELRQKEIILAALKEELQEAQHSRRDLEVTQASLKAALGSPPDENTEDDRPIMPPLPSEIRVGSDQAPLAVSRSDGPSLIAKNHLGGARDDGQVGSFFNGKPLAVEATPAPAPSVKSDQGLDILDRNRTTGVYDDRWVKPTASLAINKKCTGQKVTVTLYLPVTAQTNRPKLLFLKPNFADAAVIEIARGKPATLTFPLPDLPNFTARLGINTEAEAKNGSDVRELGVVLVSMETG